MQFLHEALRHICVMPELKRTPIDNCICGLRCIERKMRSIFQTVHNYEQVTMSNNGDWTLKCGLTVDFSRSDTPG
jgi:hypothetical protein